MSTHPNRDQAAAFGLRTRRNSWKQHRQISDGLKCFAAHCEKHAQGSECSGRLSHVRVEDSYYQVPRANQKYYGSMLGVMTLNAGYIMALLVGVFIGEVVLHRYASSSHH